MSRLWGLALAPLLATFACIERAPDATSASDDALRFRSTNVDTSLPDVDALGYEIEIQVGGEPGRETFDATVKGTYVATSSLTELSLDFEGNVITAVTAQGRPATHRRDGSRLIISLPNRAERGSTFSTRVTYHGDVRQADGADPNDFAAFGGLMVKQQNSDHKRIFTSMDWPSKARRWLPLRDHPRDTAMVAFTATFPKSFTVLANGERKSVAEDGASKTWRYEALTPMPTYDFHVSAYEGWKVDESRAASGVPITTYTYSSAHSRVRSIYSDLPKAMDFYEATFGDYRWGSAAFIEEPIFGGGMEHASVVSMDETLFSDPAEARKTAFHELAHHWSGNSVHFRTWNDFWLSEGFTEYLSGRAIEQIDGPEAGKAVWRGYLTEVLAADKSTPHALAPRLGSNGQELDVLSIFDAISYQKGALTVRLLEHVVGSDAMNTFLKRWFKAHGQDAAVSTYDLERELSASAGKDLKPLFETMIREGYHPELKASLTARPDGAVEVAIDQIQEQGPRDGFSLPIDLDLVADDGSVEERITMKLEGRRTTAVVHPARPLRSVTIDPEEWALTALAACGQSGGVATCRADYRCAPQREGISVCVPR